MKETQTTRSDDREQDDHERSFLEMDAKGRALDRKLDRILGFILGMMGAIVFFIHFLAYTLMNVDLEKTLEERVKNLEKQNTRIWIILFISLSIGPLAALLHILFDK